jgi:hypothetical protein
MAKPSNCPKPNLSRLTNRQVGMSTSRNTLEFQLFDWVRDIVRQTRQPPAGGLSPETYLMASAKDSIDVLMQAAPIGMTLGRAAGQRTVYADFHPLLKPDGHWIVDAVCFGLSANAAASQIARTRAYKQSLTEKADLRTASYVNVRKIAFPAENMPLQDFSQNLGFGDFIIGTAIERVHERAKEEAKMIENPVVPKEMIIDLLGMGISKLRTPEIRFKSIQEMNKSMAEASHAERFLAEGYNMPHILEAEGMERATRWAENVDKSLHVRDFGMLGETLQDKEKSAGDKIIEAGLTAAGFISAGPWIRVIAGMMFDIAIASDAARVTRLRSRWYIYFVAGYIKQLTMTDTGVPQSKFDQKYFDLGVAHAPMPGSPGALRTQLSLLHYASEHYTDGGWGGLGYKKQDWHFPDDYLTKWSPELLGRAFATQLHKRKYLIE